jgi:hypothetical protein
VMEPELGRRPPPSAGESATTVSPRFGRPVPAIGLVLSQAADDAADGADANAAFQGGPTDSGSVREAPLEALAQSDGADVGMRLSCRAASGGLARALTKHPFLG